MWTYDVDTDSFVEIPDEPGSGNPAEDRFREAENAYLDELDKGRYADPDEVADLADELEEARTAWAGRGFTRKNQESTS